MSTGTFRYISYPTFSNSIGLVLKIDSCYFWNFFSKKFIGTISTGMWIKFNITQFTIKGVGLISVG